MQRNRRHTANEECQDEKSWYCQQRGMFDAEMLRERREQEWTEREPQRPAGDVDRHRKARTVAAEPVRKRGRRRVERRRSEPTCNQDCRELELGAREPDEAEQTD
jgi:hypothetical protein